MPEQTQHQVMQCMEVWGGNELVDNSVELAGLDVWVYSRPYRDAKLGGDLHYVSSCATGRITRLLIADVSGHGEPVGEVTVKLRNLMRQYINFFSQNHFVESMNNEFTRHSETGLFATAVVTSFLATTRELSVSNAGHPPPLLYRKKNSTWEFLESAADTKGDRSSSVDLSPANIPLGLIDATHYDQLEITLDVGDLVLCYTDSLIESDGSDGQMLGTQGLLQTLNTLNLDQPETLIPRLLEAIACQAQGNLTKDDVTALLFRTNGKRVAVPLKRRIIAPFILFNAIVISLFTNIRHVPWPEMSMRNLGLDIFTKAPK